MKGGKYIYYHYSRAFIFTYKIILKLTQPSCQIWLASHSSFPTQKHFLGKATQQSMKINFQKNNGQHFCKYQIIFFTLSISLSLVHAV